MSRAMFLVLNNYLGQVTRRVSGRSPKAIIDDRIIAVYSLPLMVILLLPGKAIGWLRRFIRN